MKCETPCPTCGGLLVEFPSTRNKLCVDCYTEYDWELKKGQKSVLVEGLVGGLEERYAREN